MKWGTWQSRGSSQIAPEKSSLAPQGILLLEAFSYMLAKRNMSVMATEISRYELALWILPFSFKRYWGKKIFFLKLKLNRQLK